MKTNMIAKICAFLLMGLGTTVLLGWILHIPLMVQIIPGLVGMVANSACCFILFSLVFFLSNLNIHYQITLQRIILFLILLAAVTVLSQHIFHYNLGIDGLLITPWLQDPNPTPGRMAPNTTIAFILSTVVAFLIPYGQKRYIATIIQRLTLIIFLIGVISLLAYFLKLEIVFTWYSYSRMAVHTAIGFVIISIGLWATWCQQPWYKEFYQGKEDKKIILITGVILLCLTLIAGLGSISGLTYINFRFIHNSLEESLQEKIRIITGSVNAAENDISFALNNHTPSTETRFHQIINDLSKKDFSGIQILDTRGQHILQKGQFIQKPELSTPLTTKYKEDILWKDGFWLKIQAPIYQEPHHKIIGYLVGERPLNLQEKLYQNYYELGSTGEIVICSPVKKNYATCFPTRFSKKPFTVPLVLQGIALPMTYAFNGEKGITNGYDYVRKNVIAAYSPIGQLGLSIVKKIDITEIYKPIRDQLQLVLPIVILLISFGLIILYWQVAPAIRRVVASEKDANESKKNALTINKRLEQRNHEIFILRELSSTLQACINLIEAETLISHQAQQLLPEVAGSLFLIHASHNYLESVLIWGNPLLQEKILKPDDCWALRRGVIYHVDNPKMSLICPHSKELHELTPSYVCIPMLAQSDLMGLLYLEWKDNIKEEVDVSHKRTEQLNLAIVLCEQIALAISNINLRETLRNQSIRDPLTGLHNRRYLEETLEREIHRVKRKSASLIVFMIDVDHFKYFNDTFGHEAGDIVLQAISRTFNSNMRTADIACRYGGEEFILIMPEMSLEIALDRAKKLHVDIKNLHLQHQSNTLGSITVSIGIAMFPEDGTDMQELIEAADKALYQAKNTGRNKTVVYKQIK